MIMKRRRGWLYVLAMAVMLGMFGTAAMAEDEVAGDTAAMPIMGSDEGGAREGADVSFHGYFESNLVMRDENGVQYGFLDHLNAVQQRNILKFDVDVDPKVKWGNFSFSKLHLTYRGAYDSIYDLRAQKFGDTVENRGLTRFDYGLRDVKFENDLREVFIDLAYSGPLGSGFLRPGKQLISWGEGSTFTFMDVINPNDNSYQLFFQNPDDVKMPIWMVRLNYGLPAMRDLAVNFDFLWVPEIRPTQFGPLDKGKMNAPYVNFLFGSPAARNFDYRQVVPTEKQEYGAKVTMDIGERLSVSGTYYRDSNNDAGSVLNPLTGVMSFTHPMQNVWGAYFSYNVAAWDLVIRGDYARQTDVPIAASASGAVPEAQGLGLALFRLKPVTRYSLIVDKKYLVPFITSHERTSFSFEWNHQKIEKWESALDAVGAGKPVRNMDILAGSIGWSWYEGRIGPMIIFKYNPGRPGAGGGSGMIQPRVTWTITPKLYASLMMQAFLGDKTAKSGYAGMVETSEVTLKLGYQW